VVTCESGESYSLPVRYGHEIADIRFAGDMTDTPVSYYALPVWQGRDGAGEKITLYAFEWVNPDPSRAVESVVVRGGNEPAAAALLLFGITAVT